ncbi:MAG: hypothetical protein AN484_25130 [Aphanizomenon flos-aquae WA102]|uniref:Uncharacterized protein n=1 Tax=Aphanizomenon flos-aquae WA102 TaxID=1710896 RepID=A0A1B7WJG2_APHFL|nr:MAG: hypothetical protein AN484_25130 [Aphanizomenon flos-aquae WA102]
MSGADPPFQSFLQSSASVRRAESKEPQGVRKMEQQQPQKVRARLPILVSNRTRKPKRKRGERKEWSRKRW